MSNDIMSDMFSLTVTFLCGAIYECACVFWVHYSEKNNALLSALCSCLVALVTAIGLGEALHRPLFIAAYTLGFGIGTWVAIKVKARWLKMQ